MSKTILGLDTGNTYKGTGYCMIDLETKDVIDSGKVPNDKIFPIIDQCDLLALEIISFQDKCKVGNDVFQTAQWIGRFQQYAIDNGKYEIFEVTKKKHSDYHINQCWEHHGKLFKGCNDSQLKQAIEILYPNLSICKNNDARNAFSVANFVIKRYIQAT